MAVRHANVAARVGLVPALGNASCASSRSPARRPYVKVMGTILDLMGVPARVSESADDVCKCEPQFTWWSPSGAATALGVSSATSSS